MKIKIVYFILFFIVLGGFFLRIVNVTDYHLQIDESNLLDEAELKNKGLIGDLKWIFSSILKKTEFQGEPLVEFQARWIHRIFKNNVLAVRLHSVIFGILAILLWFFLVKLLMRDNRLALFSSTLLCLSFFHIFFSRYGWPHLTMSFWFLLYLFLIIYYFFYKQKFGLLLASVGAFIIGFLTAPTMVFAPLGIIIFGILSAVFKNRVKLSNYLADIRKRPIKEFLLSLFLIFLMVLAFFPSRMIFENREFQEATFGSLSGESLFQKFISFLTIHFHSFLDYQRQLWNLFESNSFAGIIPIWLIIFSLVGLLVLLFSKDKKIYLFLFQLIFFYFVVVYLRARVKPRILIPFDYLFYFAGSVGILFILKKLFKKPVIINSALILFIVLELAFTVNSLFLNDSRYPKATIIDYPYQKERVDRLIDYFKDKEAQVMVDPFDHSPAYHLEDQGISFEYMNYDLLTDKIERGKFPDYYLSYELFKRDKELYEIIKKDYKEELPGLYVRKKD